MEERYTLGEIRRYLRTQDCIQDAIDNLNDLNVGTENGVDEEEDVTDEYRWTEAVWKLDSYMSEESKDKEEFLLLIGGATDVTREDAIDRIVEIIELNCVDEEKMHSYFPKGGTVRDFAAFMVDYQSDDDDDDHLGLPEEEDED